MPRLGAASAMMVSLVMCSPVSAFSAEAVGEATAIRTEVTGENGPLVVKAPVHKDERIRTSISGLGQFVFRDGTKLAVGEGSSVVIDNYVYDDANSVKKLTIKAAKGTFRWISGNSKSSAYSIVTPAGTIGVRGTAFDFYVGPNGTTAMVLLNGSAQFCGAGGCKQLKQQCDCVIATRGGGVSDPRAVDRRTLAALGSQRALPFLSGDQQLTGPLGGIRTSCGLASVRQERRDPVREKAPAPTPPKPKPPKPPPPPPPPEKPDKPHHHHHHHDRDDHHHWGHHDRDHYGDGRPGKRGDRDGPRRGPDRGGPNHGGPNHGGPDKGGPDRGGPDRGGDRDGNHDRGRSGDGRPAGSQDDQTASDQTGAEP
ncbi:hypothetical protein A6U87_27540 [Rhizobium sp. AC44/96]|nr:hypothetical protein A6U87_27540 [Rhizobium sp. AC44/96]